MSVENPHVIDFVSFYPVADAVRLTMTEHRPWIYGAEQLLEVQEKLNAYISYIVDGQLEEQHPEWFGKSVLIDLACKYPPSKEVQAFVRMAQEWLLTNDLRHVSFSTYVVADDEA